MVICSVNHCCCLSVCISLANEYTCMYYGLLRRLLLNMEFNKISPSISESVDAWRFANKFAFVDLSIYVCTLKGFFVTHTYTYCRSALCIAYLLSFINNKYYIVYPFNRLKFDTINITLVCISYNYSYNCCCF